MQNTCSIQLWCEVNCKKNWNEFLVSKEAVVLRQWERSKQKFGFIKRVDKVWITTVKDLESWSLEREPFAIRSDEGLTLKTSAF